MKIQYTSFCETGLVRQENQDAVFCGTDGTAGLFVVADGMGGQQHNKGKGIRVVEALWVLREAPCFFAGN